jgi:small-conductance mechanosensitive channel
VGFANPIESFTGWLMNAFRRYYQVGDRILVGEVFGDVYRIDFLSTTVWEIGSPYQAGFVSAEQPTGRLVTFPNNEILTGTVINLTGDFPYVWDELNVAVANESNIMLAMKVLEKVATEALGDYMKIPAQNYSSILRRAGFTEEVPEKPQVFLATSDSWTDVIIRYLVGARERRIWKTNLLLKVNKEISKPEYKGKIIPVYVRQQIQVIDSLGMPSEINKTGEGEGRS